MRRNLAHLRDTLAGIDGIELTTSPVRGLACALDTSGAGVTSQELMVALFARNVATYPGDGMGTVGAATTLRLNLSRPDPWAMEHLRAMLPEAIAEAASGRWREPVAALLAEQGHAARDRPRGDDPERVVSIVELVAEHGSPLWLADVDRARERLAGFRAAWSAAWPRRRGRLLLQDQPHDGVPARVRRRRRRGGGRLRGRVRAGARRRRRRGLAHHRQRPVQARRAARTLRRRRRARHRRQRGRARAARAARASRGPGCASACPDPRACRAASGSRPSRSSPQVAARASSA